MKGNYTLEALNEILFEQLETLSNPDLSEEELKKEIKRSDAITKTATVIVDSANVVVKAITVRAEYSGEVSDVTGLIGGGHSNG